MAKIEQENQSHGRLRKKSMKNSVPSFESSGSPVLLFSSTPLIPPATPFTPVALIVSRSSPSYPPVTPETLVQSLFCTPFLQKSAASLGGAF